MGIQPPLDGFFVYDHFEQNMVEDRRLAVRGSGRVSFHCSQRKLLNGIDRLKGILKGIEKRQRTVGETISSLGKVGCDCLTYQVEVYEFD